MKFIYLIQTEGPTPEPFKEIEQRSKTDPNVDFLKLTYREQRDDAVFLPRSTWTEGRNRLIQEARSNAKDYDYYILCDDDLEVAAGSWQAFQDDLVKHRPALATPYYHSRRPMSEDYDVHTTYDIDAMANAVHRDLIVDGMIFPYLGKFDSDSWWISQLFVIHMAAMVYGDHVMCSNNLSVRNVQHREYNQNINPMKPASWLKYEKWMFDNIFADELFARSRFHHHYNAEKIPVRPMPAPRTTYRLTPAEKALFRTFRF